MIQSQNVKRNISAFTYGLFLIIITDKLGINIEKSVKCLLS